MHRFVFNYISESNAFVSALTITDVLNFKFSLKKTGSALFLYEWWSHSGYEHIECKIQRGLGTKEEEVDVHCEDWGADYYQGTGLPWDLEDEIRWVVQCEWVVVVDSVFLTDASWRINPSFVTDTSRSVLPCLAYLPREGEFFVKSSTSFLAPLPSTPFTPFLLLAFPHFSPTLLLLPFQIHSVLLFSPFLFSSSLSSFLSVLIIPFHPLFLLSVLSFLSFSRFPLPHLPLPPFSFVFFCLRPLFSCRLP